MAFLTRVSEILGSPVGGFVYHLILLLTVQAGFGMALDEWQRGRRSQVRRLLLATVGLTVVRVAYLVAALLSLGPWIEPRTLLPPLERMADAASIVLVAWAFVPVSTGPAPGRTNDVRLARASSVTLILNLILVVAAGVVFAVQWNGAAAADPGLNYNDYWQAKAWLGWQIGLIVLSGLAVMLNRAEERMLLVLAMLYLLGGRIVSLAFPAPIPSLPIWDRLANLVAYPLIAVAVYQRIIAGLQEQVEEVQEISQASLDQIKSLLTLFEASRQAARSLELPTVLDTSVQGVARALDADQCAIALTDDTDPGQMRLAAVYNPARPTRGEVIRFPLEYQLTIQQAMRRRKPILVDELENVQLKVLFALLGSPDVGPLLVQPLLLDGEAMGVIIVGNSRSRRPFTAHEAKLCQTMAEQVIIAIQNARRYLVAQDRIKELHRSLDEERRSPHAGLPAHELAERPAGSLGKRASSN